MLKRSGGKEVINPVYNLDTEIDLTTYFRMTGSKAKRWTRVQTQQPNYTNNKLYFSTVLNQYYYNLASMFVRLQFNISTQNTTGLNANNGNGTYTYFTQNTIQVLVPSGVNVAENVLQGLGGASIINAPIAGAGNINFRPYLGNFCTTYTYI